MRPPTNQEHATGTESQALLALGRKASFPPWPSKTAYLCSDGSHRGRHSWVSVGVCVCTYSTYNIHKIYIYIYIHTHTYKIHIYIYIYIYILTYKQTDKHRPTGLHAYLAGHLPIDRQAEPHLVKVSVWGLGFFPLGLGFRG